MPHQATLALSCCEGRVAPSSTREAGAAGVLDKDGFVGEPAEAVRRVLRGETVTAPALAAAGRRPCVSGNPYSSRSAREAARWSSKFWRYAAKTAGSSYLRSASSLYRSALSVYVWLPVKTILLSGPL